MLRRTRPPQRTSFLVAPVQVRVPSTPSDPLAARPLDKVPTNPIPTPSRPFTVIHVDHADFRGRPSGPRKYLYMLIVTCALTRFTAPDRYVALVMDDDSLEVLYDHAVRHLHAHVEWFAPSYAVF